MDVIPTTINTSNHVAICEQGMLLQDGGRICQADGLVRSSGVDGNEERETEGVQVRVCNWKG